MLGVCLTINTFTSYRFFFEASGYLLCLCPTGFSEQAIAAQQIFPAGNTDARQHKNAGTLLPQPLIPSLTGGGARRLQGELEDGEVARQALGTSNSRASPKSDAATAVKAASS